MNDIQSTPKHRILEQVTKEELITLQEELALIHRAKNGDENALAQLIKVNKRFVRVVAKKYEGYGLSLNELIAEGNEGLKLACMKYDPSKGFKFISYAVWWIKTSITNALKEQIFNN